MTLPFYLLYRIYDCRKFDTGHCRRSGVQSATAEGGT